MLSASSLINHFHNSAFSQQLAEGDANPNEAIMSEIKLNRFPF